METEPSPSLELRFLPGIGPLRAAALAACGLRTVWDLLHWPPQYCGEAPDEVSAGPLPRGRPVQVRAQVLRLVTPQRGWRGRTSFEVHLRRADGSPARARFFNAGYLRDRLCPGESYLFEGRTDPHQAALLNHPRFSHLIQGLTDPQPGRQGGEVRYRLPPGIGEQILRRAVGLVLDRHLPAIHDPAGLLSPDRYQAHLRAIHRPTDQAAYEAARQVLAERELLALAWLLQRRRARITGRVGRSWRWDEHIHARALARLPFTLTPGQTEAGAQIRADLQATSPMYRLLQGDVGSGKTALALLACLAVIADRAQAMILAPTAVLAQQHHDFCGRCLKGSRVRVGLLTGGTPAKERGALLAALASGEMDLLIGTHALLEDRVVVADLGLAVIDEQHKFGVAQRARLVAKAQVDGDRPPVDLLILTATPIPRTLALTLFGDLAVSRIADKPPGRAPVRTEVLRLRQPDLLSAITAARAAGGRAYVVTPLKDESESLTAADAISVAGALVEHFGPEEVGLVHGSLREDDKIAALRAFRDGRTRILVATTVIEVGVDVPEANLMAVLDAERFGLAQLHQLRGRIGRGPLPGLCQLYHRSPQGGERLRVLAASDDGLDIAQADLAERGPGEFLGTRQHGLPVLTIADLNRDARILEQAHARVRTALAAGQNMPTSLARFLPDDHRAELLSGG